MKLQFNEVIAVWVAKDEFKNTTKPGSGQNVTGQIVTRTKCHTDKMSPGQNVTGTKLCLLESEEFLASNYAENYHIVRKTN